METTHDELRLRPARGVTARWSLVGGLATVLATWAALDARESVLAWAFAALCLLLTTYPLLQLARPSRFALRLDAAGVELAMPWQQVRYPWERIHLARVVTVVGEPVLELHVWDAEHPDGATPRATGMLVPLGADLDALHAQLASHLGHAEPR